MECVLVWLYANYSTNVNVTNKRMKIKHFSLLSYSLSSRRCHRTHEFFIRWYWKVYVFQSHFGIAHESHIAGLSLRSMLLSPKNGKYTWFYNDGNIEAHCQYGQRKISVYMWKNWENFVLYRIKRIWYGSVHSNLGRVQQISIHSAYTLFQEEMILFA